jgi:uncharacterized membrane protein
MDLNQEQLRKKRSGQVVTEYVMILSFVFIALVVAKLPVTESGSIDITGQSQNTKTILEVLSKSFSMWMQDIVIIMSFPS